MFIYIYFKYYITQVRGPVFPEQLLRVRHPEQPELLQGSVSVQQVSCHISCHSCHCSPRDREASTSPTTSAIKTVQNILASLHAAQTPLTQLVALQAPLSPWSSLGLPLAPGLQGLASLSSEAGNMQQLYLQHHHHALQQTLHTLMPPYTHPSGQTQTMMLQNQVR